METLLIKNANEEQQVVTQDNFNPLEGMHGDYSSKEILRPKLDIVHGVGELSNIFEPGSLVYNREMALITPIKTNEGPKPGTPIGVTIFGSQKFFVQNIGFDPDVKPAIFYSEDDVLKSGGNITPGVKVDEDPDNFLPGAILTAVVKLPEDKSHALGAIDFEDVFYAPVTWTIKKSAYTRA